MRLATDDASGVVTGEDERRRYVLAAWVAIVGSVLVTVANVIHPRTADIATVVGLLRTISVHDHWLLYHLGIIFSLVILVVGQVAIGRHLVRGHGRGLRVMAEASFVAGAAVLLVNFAFDGIAFKTLADAWANAGDQQDAFLQIVSPVVLVGFSLFSMSMIAFFGVPFVLYALAVFYDRAHSWWIGVVGLVAGIGGMVTGVMQVLRGPTRLTIDFMFPPVAAVGTVFTFLLAISVLRAVRRTEGAPPA